MRAAIVQAPGQVEVAEVPDPVVRAGEIIVKVGACGVCGTDLHIVDGEFPAAVFPLIPGHEFAGEVVEVGPGVDGLRSGARVAVDPALSCGACAFCRTGQRHLCVNRGAFGGTADGGFAEYVRVPYENAYLLPDHVTYQEGALVEPVSCVVHGFHVLKPKLGDTFLVVGAGAAGLLFVQLALRGGASTVDVVNRSEHRRARALRVGATRVAGSVHEVLEHRPLGYDCVVEATGVPRMLETALDAVKPGGKLLVYGVAPAQASVTVSPYRLYRDEITVLGTMGIHYGYAPALDLIASGALDTELMLTHRFGLGDFPNALDAVRRGEGVKVQVTS